MQSTNGNVMYLQGREYKRKVCQMKRISALLLCAALMCMTACGNSGDSQSTTEAESTEAPSGSSGYEYDLSNYEFYQIDDFSQYVSLGQYEGITVRVTPTDEEIDERIQQVLKTYAEKTEVTDRTVEEGDTVTVDYTGYMDGETFAGGSGTDRTLVVGSNTFLEDFENGLIGASTGEEFEIDAVFPEDYFNADYAGKPATFKVTVKKIEAEVLPELNDEFANRYNSEYQNVEDFRAGLAEQIKSENMEESVLTNSAWNAVINNCEIKDVPEEMIKYYYDSLYASYVYYVYYNYEYDSIEEYLEHCDDLTMDDLTGTLMTQAQGYAVSELVYRAICADKGYEITDEEYNGYKESCAADSSTEPTDIEIRQALLWDYAKGCVLDTVVCE